MKQAIRRAALTLCPVLLAVLAVASTPGLSGLLQ